MPDDYIPTRKEDHHVDSSGRQPSDEDALPWEQPTTEAPDELQRIQPQPTRLKHRATPKIKLPTGETITEHQKSRRVHHAGFPPITQASPKDIQQEDIIKHWPNHLWGPLLLQIAALWTPKEISKMTPIKFGPNSVVKRVKAARNQEGQDSVRANKRKRQPASKDAESSDELQRLPQPEVPFVSVKAGCKMR
ncbi:hypothetical protein OEA41_007805 [Lepraria neglecta]|uniref:Uncharacterized protein n=1 Tax=Lepraria neglecta TaxID=209136 RepID=A0AAD9ZDI3_9LECA|nr:hypothetical protein OEA41_007805 [Lepraria neglecta]